MNELEMVKWRKRFAARELRKTISPLKSNISTDSTWLPVTD